MNNKGNNVEKKDGKWKEENYLTPKVMVGW